MWVPFIIRFAQLSNLRPPLSLSTIFVCLSLFIRHSNTETSAAKPRRESTVLYFKPFGKWAKFEPMHALAFFIKSLNHSFLTFLWTSIYIISISPFAFINRFPQSLAVQICNFVWNRKRGSGVFGLTNNGFFADRVIRKRTQRCWK